ncbi:MAG: hypothetical protein P8Y03_21970 [Anaerolineales bacterium]
MAEVIQGADVGDGGVEILGDEVGLVEGGEGEAGAAVQGLGVLLVAEQGAGEGQANAGEMGDGIVVGAGGAVRVGEEGAHVDGLGEDADAAGVHATAGEPVDPVLGIILPDASDETGRGIRLPDGQAGGGVDQIAAGDVEEGFAIGEDDEVAGEAAGEDEAGRGGFGRVIHQDDYTSEWAMGEWRIANDERREANCEWRIGVGGLEDWKNGRLEG